MPLLLYCEFLTQWSTSFTATDFEGREEEERISLHKEANSQKREAFFCFSSTVIQPAKWLLGFSLMQQVLKLLHSTKAEKKPQLCFRTNLKNPGFPFLVFENGQKYFKVLDELIL